MNRYLKSLCILGLAFSFNGAACAATLASFLPQFIAITAEAGNAITVVENLVSALSPDAALKAKINNVLDKCRTALAIANRIGAGASDLQKQDANAALADFRTAYTELLDLIAPLLTPVQAAAIKSHAIAKGLIMPPRPLAADPIE